MGGPGPQWDPPPAETRAQALPPPRTPCTPPKRPSDVSTPTPTPSGNPHRTSRCRMLHMPGRPRRPYPPGRPGHPPPSPGRAGPAVRPLLPRCMRTALAGGPRHLPDLPVALPAGAGGKESRRGCASCGRRCPTVLAGPHRCPHPPTRRQTRLLPRPRAAGLRDGPGKGHTSVRHCAARPCTTMARAPPHSVQHRVH